MTQASDIKVNCSVTVMLITNGRMGFIRRAENDSYPGLLVAPGGKVEMTDGTPLDGVSYWSVEEAALREVLEETGISIARSQLQYFCSLTLPNGRIVISLYAILKNFRWQKSTLEWLRPIEILSHTDFAPGMQQEAILLLKKLRLYKVKN